ncbi:MAG: hypothetical protein ABL927_02465 [Bdellovibrionales bacterium]
MKNKTFALISVKVFSTSGLEQMKQVVKEIVSKFEINRISSVYSVSRTAESLQGLRDIKKEETLQGLSAVLRVQTQEIPKIVLSVIGNIELKLQKEILNKSVSCNLLVYGNEVSMLPELSLPHPEFHLRPEEVIPAAEIWPEYVHPVLNLNLSELSRQFQNQEWGEFFTQGSQLLPQKASELDF